MQLIYLETKKEKYKSFFLIDRKLEGYELASLWFKLMCQSGKHGRSGKDLSCTGSIKLIEIIKVLSKNSGTVIQ